MNSSFETKRGLVHPPSEVNSQKRSFWSSSNFQSLLISESLLSSCGSHDPRLMRLFRGFLLLVETAISAWPSVVFRNRVLILVLLNKSYLKYLTAFSFTLEPNSFPSSSNAGSYHAKQKIKWLEMRNASDLNCSTILLLLSSKCRNYYETIPET